MKAAHINFICVWTLCMYECVCALAHLTRRSAFSWTHKAPRLNFYNCKGTRGGSQVELVVKNPSANAGVIRDMGLIPGLGRSLEEGMAIHSSIPAWRTPLTEEPGRLQSMGPQRVRHDWATERTHTHTHTHYKSMSNFEVAMCALHYLRLVWCVTLFDFCILSQPRSTEINFNWS